MRSARAGRQFGCSLLCLAALAAVGCSARVPPDQADRTDWAAQRRQLVDEQLRARGIRNERVLTVMGRVPRHEFVPASVREFAYADSALPIGEGQTISQPYVVALMTEAAEPQPGHRVLEVGTGSGYQAAVLAELAGEVYTIELLPALAEQARTRLERLGYANVHVRTGDGYQGWPEAAPFDAILVTCGADHVPEPLFAQLKPGGTMVIPIGNNPEQQSLRVIRKGPTGEPQVRDLAPVRFVPLRRGSEAQRPG
jgi:protein-L-isoaspartate(D-aspartate) O-methyltransferase